MAGGGFTTWMVFPHLLVAYLPTRSKVSIPSFTLRTINIVTFQRIPLISILQLSLL